MINAEQGLKEIRAVQVKYNDVIDRAPVKAGYNKLTGTYTTSKRDYERVKFNAIKSIVQDYAVFGINLLSDESLETLRPKEESVGAQYRQELGE